MGTSGYDPPSQAYRLCSWIRRHKLRRHSRYECRHPEDSRYRNGAGSSGQQSDASHLADLLPSRRSGWTTLPRHGVRGDDRDASSKRTSGQPGHIREMGVLRPSGSRRQQFGCRLLATYRIPVSAFAIMHSPLGGPRQCLRVDILPDVRQFAISNGNGEDPMVLERPIRGFDSPRSEADDQNPVSLRYELGGLWVRSFHRFVSLLKQIRQSRVPAVRAGQRPVLARNDPLNIFGRQRQQTLLIAAAECRKKILHNLDILFDAHRNLSISLTSSVSDLIRRLGTILLGPNHTVDDRLLLFREATAPGSDLRHASIDGEIHTGDVRTFIGSKEHDCCRDFLGHASATHWDLRGELCGRLLGLFSGKARRRR